MTLSDHSSATNEEFEKQDPATTKSTSTPSKTSHPSDTGRSVTSERSGKMLSVDFSTPLAGAARSERIRQMSKNHAAFEKSRQSQEILVKIQQSLRRMPGVSASESHEIIHELKEVGQMISQETSALVDALMNVSLDQEDTERAVARLSIEGNIAKAETDKKMQRIDDLERDLANEIEKRREAEVAVKQAVDQLQKLMAEFRELKRKSADDGTQTPEIIRSLEETISHLNDQVNSRRSLWLMKNTDPDSVARAIETLASSVQDNQAAQKALLSLKSAAAPASDDDGGLSRMLGEFPMPTRPTSVFQATHRPNGNVLAPSKMGYGRGHNGGGNAPRRYQGSWANTPAPYPHQSKFGSFGGPAVSSFSKMGANRRAASANRFTSPGDWNFQGDSYHNPRGSMYASRDYFPPTPTASNRSGSGRYSRLSEARSDAGASTALVPRHQGGSMMSTGDEAVQGWHDSVMELYGLARTFVENHSVAPEPALAHKVSMTPIWPILLATYFPLSENEAGSYLEYHLRNENSKSCLITRVIVDYIVNRVWAAGAWTGHDAESTHALIEIERDLEKMHGQSSVIRQPLLDRQATIINTMLKGDQAAEFTKTKVEDITRTLLTSLKPLLDKQNLAKDVYQDMEKVAEHAWEMSSRILTSRLTFDFRFPEIGSRFSSQSMLPVWPQLDPLELQAKHWRIALVTTPVITCRNDTGTNISAHSVALADVFCMQ